MNYKIKYESEKDLYKIIQQYEIPITISDYQQFKKHNLVQVKSSEYVYEFTPMYVLIYNKLSYEDLY